MRGFKVQVQLSSYTVKFTGKKDKYFDPNTTQGLCSPNVKRIYVSAKLSDDNKFTAYIHGGTQGYTAIFFELGEDGLAYNEPFVETISQIIARAVRELPEGFK